MSVPMLLLIIAVLGVPAVFAVGRCLLTVVTVRGDSMEPTYLDGDRVLIARVRRLALRRGAVVIFDLPGSVRPPPTWVIKRLNALPGDLTPELVPARLREPTVPMGHVTVFGDSPGYDSRLFGYLPVAMLRGVVVAHLGRME